MKKLFAILTAALITCGIMVAPAFAADTSLEAQAIHEGAVYESETEAVEAMEAEEAAVPDTETVVYDEVIQMDDKVVTDKEAWDETIEHPAVTHEETVVDEEAYDETIEHPAVTHEETVIDKEAWDEQVCTPGTDPYGYKIEGDGCYNFIVEEYGAFVLIKQASDYVVIWSEDADFEDYPTAKEIAAAAKDGSIKNQQVIKWRGFGEFNPYNLGNPWNHWYEFYEVCGLTHFYVDSKDGISHADVYVPGKPGECVEVHHGRIIHYETVVDEEAWTETIHHDAITHQETIIDKPAWTETVHHDAITHEVEQWTYVFLTETNLVPVPPTPEPPAPAPAPNNTIVINNDMTPVGANYLPKTADEMITPAGTAFLIILVGLLVLAIAAPWLNKDEDEEEEE